jgi:hypothetical protein
MHFFEIWVEASTTPQVLHSSCLQSQHHTDKIKVLCQQQQ